jgi:hypothetical protein
MHLNKGYSGSGRDAWFTCIMESDPLPVEIILRVKEHLIDDIQ